MTQYEVQKSEKIISPEVDPAYKSKLKQLVASKRLLVAVPVILVVLIILTTGLFVYRNYTNKQYAALPAETKKLVDASLPAQEGKLEESKQQFDSLIASEDDTKQKALYMQAKANACASTKDYACAIAANDEALVLLGEDYGLLRFNGDWSYSIEQKDKGNSYYQRAIVVLQQDGSQDAQNLVKELQDIMAGKPVQGTGQ